MGTVVMFRCKEAATVETFLSQLPIVPILRVTPSLAVQTRLMVKKGFIIALPMKIDLHTMNNV